jgi:hypothetical protein
MKRRWRSLALCHRLLPYASHGPRSNSISPLPGTNIGTASVENCKDSLILKNIHGRNMMPGSKQELRDEHFRQLTSAWEGKKKNETKL